MRLTPALLLGPTFTRILASPLEPEAASPSVTVPAGATKTTIWSTTQSLTTYYEFINPRRLTLYTTITATSLEPRWPTTAFPASVTETIISSVVVSTRLTYLDSGSTSTEVTSYVYTASDTWVVHRPKATDLAAAAALRCSEKDTGAGCNSGPADPLCKAEGLKTACQGQCDLRPDGYWWCYMMRQRDYKYPEMQMGRACWGGNLQFRQLNAPCVAGDAPMACVPCQGIDLTWGPVNWSGPEAGN